MLAGRVPSLADQALQQVSARKTLYEYEPSTDRAAYNRVLASANGVNQAIEQEIHRAWRRGLNPDHTRSQEARA